MQFVRTLLWVLILVGLLVFSFFNWRPVEVTIWENLVLETKVSALVIVSFLLGLLPMWLLHRGASWRLKRRISSLETAAESQRRLNTPTPSPAPATTDASATTATTTTSPDPTPAPAPTRPREPDAGPLTSDKT